MTNPTNDTDYHTHIERRQGYLLVSVTGRVCGESLPPHVNIFEPMASACREHNCFRVLMDARDAEVNLRLFHIVRAAVDLGVFRDLPLRVATLVREEAVRTDHLFQSAAEYEGVTVKVFSEQDEAMASLLDQAT